jgi:hypothetical protein
MKNSSARKGTLQFTPEEQKKIASLKEAAKSEICWDGAPPSDSHRATLYGIDVLFFLNVDKEDRCGQYQLHLSKKTGEQPGLDEVQAMAFTFFEGKDYQLLPDERNANRIRVLGLFFKA